MTAEIVTLGIAIDSADAVTAKTNLAALVPAATATQAAFGGLEKAALPASTALAAVTTNTLPATEALNRLRGASEGHTLSIRGQSQALRGLKEDLALVSSQFGGVVGTLGTMYVANAHLIHGFSELKPTLTAIGSGITEFLVTPAGVVTTALAVAGLAAYEFYDAVMKPGPDAKAVLKDHDEAIKQIKADWEAATKSADVYAMTTAKNAAQFATLTDRNSLTDLLNAQQKEAAGKMNFTLGGIPGLAPSSDWGPLQAAVDNFSKMAAQARGNVFDLNAEVRAIANADPSNTALHDLATSLLMITKDATTTTQALADLAAQQRALGAGTIVPRSAGISSAFDVGFGDTGAAMKALKGELLALHPELTKAAAEAERLAKAEQARIDGVTKSLAFETDQLGRSSRDQAIWNDLQRAGVTATSAAGLAIEAQAGHLYDLREAQKSWSTMLGTAADQSKSFLADMTSGLQKGENGWRALGDAVGNLKDRLITLAENAAVDKLFANLAGGFGGALGSASSFAGGMGSASTGYVWGGVNHGGYGPGDSMAGRYVHPSYFDSAPRFHSGIGPGERPAIIRTDEAVLTPGQLRGLAPAGRSQAPAPVELHIHNAPAGTSSTQSRTAGGGVRIDVMIDDTGAALIASGESKHNKALETRYGLTPRL